MKPQPETFSPREFLAYLNHRAELRRQFWTLVRNRPTRFFKFWRQYRELLAQTDTDIFLGKYVDAMD